MSQPTSRRWLPLVLGAAFALVAAYALVPALWPEGPAALAARWTFSGLCHQEPGRSFALDGHAMAICHRCTGIYLGLGLGAWLALAVAVDPKKKWLWALGAAPIALQVLLAWLWPALDLWWLRTGTGLATGAMGGLLLGGAVRGTR